MVYSGSTVGRKKSVVQIICPSTTYVGRQRSWESKNAAEFIDDSSWLFLRP